MRWLTCVTAGALWMGWALAADAQSRPDTVRCDGQRIEGVRITSLAPTVSGLRNHPVLWNIARAVHATTTQNVVDRFLLLHVGDRCSERRRAESERVLRAQPFIADASITVLSGRNGGVILDVQTIDEVAAVFSATVKAKGGPLFTGLRLGDANVGGEGIYLAGGWWHEDALRDGYQFRGTDYQFLGRPYQATVSGARFPLGGQYHFDIQRPFLTDVQRVAWRVQQGEADNYIRFADGSGGVHADRLSRTYADIGGLVRIGAPGRLALVGFSLSHDQAVPGTAPLLITPQGTVPDPTFPLDSRYRSHSASRINALLGYRNLRYVRTTGFDALRNVQDIPVGIQIGTLIGRSAAFLGSRDRDVLVGGDMYVGEATPKFALRFQANAEARRGLDSARWNGVLGSGRLAAYRKIARSQMFITSLEWAGGWRVQVPFRVTLAGRDGGIRGMAEGLEQGGQRAILRIEERLDLGTRFNGAADLGLAFFTDAGRLWAGDVPFGSTTPIRYSAGISLLAALPARSARMWRLDIAVPNVPGRGLRLALRISHDDRTTIFWREPVDVATARERSVPAGLFNWP